ncbi:MAG: hypothetical protein D6793_04690, partial [Thermoflexia bacterium]
VRLRAELCIGCGNCVQACPFGAVFWDNAQNKPQICVYCGYCARYGSPVLVAPVQVPFKDGMAVVDVLVSFGDGEGRRVPPFRRGRRTDGDVIAASYGSSLL